MSGKRVRSPEEVLADLAKAEAEHAERQRAFHVHKWAFCLFGWVLGLIKIVLYYPMWEDLPDRLRKKFESEVKGRIYDQVEDSDEAAALIANKRKFGRSCSEHFVPLEWPVRLTKYSLAYGRYGGKWGAMTGDRFETAEDECDLRGCGSKSVPLSYLPLWKITAGRFRLLLSLPRFTFKLRPLPSLPKPAFRSRPLLLAARNISLAAFLLVAAGLCFDTGVDLARKVREINYLSVRISALESRVIHLENCKELGVAPRADVEDEWSDPPKWVNAAGKPWPGPTESEEFPANLPALVDLRKMPDLTEKSSAE